MKPNLRPFLLHAAVFAFAATVFAPVPAGAAEVNSRLNEITRSKKLRVCQFPLYYSISFRNPKTGVIEGIDADLAKELAKDLGAQLEIVESSFGTFIADLQANKCDIGMFALGASLQRAQAVEFSKPYLITNVYAVTRKDGAAMRSPSPSAPCAPAKPSTAKAATRSGANSCRPSAASPTAPSRSASPTRYGQN